MLLLVTGISGFVGGHLIKRLSNDSKVSIVGVDCVAPGYELPANVEFFQIDMSQGVDLDLKGETPDWIIHFAAVCREPGYTRKEYFQHNVEATKRLVAYAEKVGCQKIYFTSSMATYGTSSGPSDEASLQAPLGHYGSSKLAAEWVLKEWVGRRKSRKLVICRPGVVYGPGDVQNIPRMIRAVRAGTFVLPLGYDVYKSYSYVKGLLDSMFFTMDRCERELVYNYVEEKELTMSELVRVIRKEFGVKRPLLKMPLCVLLFCARFMQVFSFGKSAYHPVRVKKVVTSTYLIPKKLQELGFEFRWDFESSLKDWRKESPGDFGKGEQPFDKLRGKPLARSSSGEEEVEDRSLSLKEEG